MKKLLQNILITIWRIWFYAVFLGTILFAVPVLLIVTAKESWYPIFFKIAKFWANTILFLMGFRVKKLNRPLLEKGKSYMFVANHTSMIDILLMFSIIKTPFLFLGKAELGKMPIFGYFYKRTNILVDRRSLKSSKKAFQEAHRRLSGGMSLCIFPEGGVPDDESIVLDEFKSGAFRLATAHEISILPMSFYDCKKRFSYTFFSGKPGQLRVRFHDVIQTKFTDDKREVNQLKDAVFHLIHNDLIKNQ